MLTPAMAVVILAANQPAPAIAIAEQDLSLPPAPITLPVASRTHPATPEHLPTRSPGQQASSGQRSAGTPDLTVLWDALQQHAPSLDAARAAQRAGRSQGDQARALWRPDVTINASAHYGNVRSSTRGAQFSAPGFGAVDDARFDTHIRQARSNTWGVTINQPLYSPQRKADSTLLDISAASADLQWLDARQALMLALTRSYFELGLAQRSVTLLQQHYDAVTRLLTETRDRHTLGDVPITDVHETAARAEALRADLANARTRLDLQQTALRNLTGIVPDPATVRLPSSQLDTRTPGTLDDWQTKAIHQNPTLLLMAQHTRAAETEAGRHGALADAQVNLTAGVGGERSHGNGRAGRASQSARQAWAGVELILPISTSGLRSAQQREALHWLDNARAKYADIRQTIDHRVEAAWRALKAGQTRIDALQASAHASAQRLAATRLGRQAGERTTLDVLNAENDDAAARLLLDEALVELLMQRLELVALAGELSVSDLQWAWSQTRQEDRN